MPVQPKSDQPSIKEMQGSDTSKLPKELTSATTPCTYPPQVMKPEGTSTPGVVHDYGEGVEGPIPGPDAQPPITPRKGLSMPPPTPTNTPDNTSTMQRTEDESKQKYFGLEQVYKKLENSVNLDISDIANYQNAMTFKFNYACKAELYYLLANSSSKPSNQIMTKLFDLVTTMSKQFAELVKKFENVEFIDTLYTEKLAELKGTFHMIIKERT